MSHSLVARAKVRRSSILF